MPTIYPLLKSHDWPHKDLAAHLPLPGNVERAPVIAFGFDAGSHYQFVTKAKCKDVDQLYAESLANLAALEYPWQLGDSHGLRFAASSGNEFSSEKVLDSAAMLKCHQILEADQIVVAAPRRTCLFATRHGLPGAELNLFIEMTMYTYRDDSYGHAPISPALFVVEQGSIKEISFADTASRAKPWWRFWA